MVNSEKVKKVLSALAVGGAFMVPIAGLPLAVLVAKKLYGDQVDFEKIKDVLSKLIRMKRVQQDQVSLKDWIIYSEVGTMASGITGGVGDIASFKRPIGRMIKRNWPNLGFAVKDKA